jgi:radical SAM superfamily enzyme YgiQ (UPF0313 family)
MKICLINPKNLFVSSYQPLSDWYWQAPEMERMRFFSTGPSLGLLTVASLTPPDIEVEYIDEVYAPIDFKQNYDLVGVTGMPIQAMRAYQIAEEFRKRGVKTVMGGQHATIMPDEVSRHVDTVVCGEAERQWGELIQDLRKNRLQRFYGDPRAGTVALSTSPLPRYELLNPVFYGDVPIQISRGCSHDCDFCCTTLVYGKKFRHKTIAQILEQVETVLKLWPKKPYIYFSDENMFVARGFVKELLKKLIPYKLNWHTNSDISIAWDEELLELIYLSGGRRILFGVESINDSSMDGIDRHNWKFKQVKKYKEAIHIIQEHGIAFYGSFIVGLDNDGTDIFQKTLDFVRDAKIFSGQFAVPTPFPGTRLYHRVKAENRLLSEDWSKYSGVEVLITPKKMSVDELQEGMFWLWKNVVNFEYFKQMAEHFKNIMGELGHKMRIRRKPYVS